MRALARAPQCAPPSFRPACAGRTTSGSGGRACGANLLNRLRVAIWPPLSSAPLMNIHKGNHKIRIADHKLPYANYFPFHTVKRGSGGAYAPPPPPGGGAEPPPAPPPTSQTTPPPPSWVRQGGTKMADPIILYFHFPITTRHVTAKGWRL